MIGVLWYIRVGWRGRAMLSAGAGRETHKITPSGFLQGKPGKTVGSRCGPAAVNGDETHEMPLG